MPAGGQVPEGGGGEAELGPHLVAGLEAAQLGGQQRVGHDILVNVPVLDAGDVDQLPGTLRNHESFCCMTKAAAELR